MKYLGLQLLLQYTIDWDTMTSDQDGMYYFHLDIPGVKEASCNPDKWSMISKLKTLDT